MSVHYFHLLGRSWENMVIATGTNTLGFIVWTLLITVAGWAATVGGRWIEFKQKKTDKPFRKALRSSLWADVLLAAGVCGLVLMAFDVSLILAVYKDYQTQMAKIVQLQQDIPQKDQEIRDLRQRPIAACYMPDRHLTREQRDALHDRLRNVAEKYNHPHIVIGIFSGDTESWRFFGELWTLLRDSGFIVPQQPLERQQWKNSNDPQSFGFSEGLSIQVVMGDKTVEDSPRNRLAGDIEKCFNDSHLMMTQLLTGKGASIPMQKDLILWIGAKRVNWLESGDNEAQEHHRSSPPVSGEFSKESA